MYFVVDKWLNFIGCFGNNLFLGVFDLVIDDFFVCQFGEVWMLFIYFDWVKDPIAFFRHDLFNEVISFKFWFSVEELWYEALELLGIFYLAASHGGDDS